MLNGMSLAGYGQGRQLMQAFGGLNETYGCGEAEWTEMKNFSSRGYPALQTRKMRGMIFDEDAAIDDVNGMYSLNGIVMIRGTDLIYWPNGDRNQETVVEDIVTDSKKQMVGMGTKLLIWPDKVSFDTATGNVTQLEAKWDSDKMEPYYEQTIYIEPCDGDGKTYSADSVGRTEPENPEDGYVFLKTGPSGYPYGSDATLEVWSEESGSWETVTMSGVLVGGGGIGVNLSVGDVITLKNVIPKISLGDSSAYLVDMFDGLEGDFLVTNVKRSAAYWIEIAATMTGGQMYGRIIWEGRELKWQSLDGKVEKYFGDYVQITGPITLERRVPDLDFITECENRVWGCNSEENVIYACKLGDPTNWFYYQGTAADSFAVTVGSEGKFTGAVTCMGYVIMWKENCLHKLYGSKPSDYQMSSVVCRGVVENGHRSLRVHNETLYYLSVDGIMAWDGSLPERVSTSLAADSFAHTTYASAGVLENRYYLYYEAQDNDGNETKRLLVLDTEKGLWHEEDAMGREMCATGRQMYLWEEGGNIWASDADRAGIDAENRSSEDGVDFEAVSGDMGMSSPDDKYVSRITVRADANREGTELHIWMSGDGGAWKEMGWAAASEDYERMNIAFAPRRCDTFRLKITGHGEVAIRSIALTMAAAGGARIKKS